MSKITKEDFVFNKETRHYELFVNGMRFEVPERNWDSFTQEHIDTIPALAEGYTPSEAFGKDYQILADMYNDDFYPKFLVDKLKSELEKIIAFLETGERNLGKIQNEFDRAFIEMNKLQDEFSKNNSELETVARESVWEAVEYIVRKFNLEIDFKEASRKMEF